MLCSPTRASGTCRNSRSSSAASCRPAGRRQAVRASRCRRRAQRVLGAVSVFLALFVGLTAWLRPEARAQGAVVVGADASRLAGRVGGRVQRTAGCGLVVGRNVDGYQVEVECRPTCIGGVVVSSRLPDTMLEAPCMGCHTHAHTHMRWRAAMHQPDTGPSTSHRLQLVPTATLLAVAPCSLCSLLPKPTVPKCRSLHHQHSSHPPTPTTLQPHNPQPTAQHPASCPGHGAGDAAGVSPEHGQLQLVTPHGLGAPARAQHGPLGQSCAMHNAPPGCQGQRGRAPEGRCCARRYGPKGESLVLPAAGPCLCRVH